MRKAVMRAMLVASIAGLASPLRADVIVVKAGQILSGTGDPIASGMVVIRDGVIAAVGAGLAIPDGAEVIDASDAVVTPGLIDAMCTVAAGMPRSASEYYALTGQLHQPGTWDRLADHAGQAALHAHEGEEPCGVACAGPRTAFEASERLAAGVSAGATWAEQSSEVTPHLRVLDSVDLHSPDFARLARGGVTTVFVSPDSASVIGARGAIVKTAGRLGQRVVRAADAVKVSLGEDPCARGASNQLPYGGWATFHMRRPTTRMGVDWVLHKAFYDAQRAAAGLPLKGVDVPAAAAIPILQGVLKGEIPLRVQARQQLDIFEMLRTAREFNLRFTLEEATEAYQCLDELKAAGVPVIYGPIYDVPQGYRSFVGEGEDGRLNTPARLAERGIAFALTAQELRDEEGLVRQGMYAVRYGLTKAQALAAITSVPAELMGLKGKVGVLAAGAAADLVVWSGDPFDASSRAKLVFIDGKVVSRN